MRGESWVVFGVMAAMRGDFNAKKFNAKGVGCERSLLWELGFGFVCMTVIPRSWLRYAVEWT